MCVCVFEKDTRLELAAPQLFLPFPKKISKSLLPPKKSKSRPPIRVHSYFSYDLRVIIRKLEP